MNTNPEHGRQNHELTPRVLIVGVSTRAVAESAARAGFEVIALDAYADLDQHPSVRALSLPRDFAAPFSPGALLTAARSLPSEAIVYLSSLENHPRAVDALAADRALWGNRSDVLRRVRDPKGLAAALSRRGLRAPRVLTHEDAAPHDDGRRWMLKPRVSGGGHGVGLWQPGQAVDARHYLQEFVEGTAGSVVFVAAGGRAVTLGMTRQLIGDAAFGATGFRYCGNILSARQDWLSDVIALVDAVSEAFALAGVGSIDVIAGSDGLVPVEVNPRWTASMELVEQARGVSMFALHAGACARGELPAFDAGALLANPMTHGKAIVFARNDVAIGDTRPWLEDSTVRDVPHEGERIAAGQPICTVFAAGVDDAECYARLVERAARLYRDLD